MKNVKVESLKFKDEVKWNTDATVDELVRDFSDLIDNVSVIAGDFEAELLSSPTLTVGELEKLIEDWIVPNLITLSNHIRKNTELK